MAVRGCVLEKERLIQMKVLSFTLIKHRQKKSNLPLAQAQGRLRALCKNHRSLQCALTMLFLSFDQV